MADPFLAEIRIYPFSFPPKTWAFCNGQLMPISQNTALFSLLGTFYGGDGKSTFALPNLQASVAMHAGQGQGLSERFLGESAGSQFVTLLQSEMPVHTHSEKVGLGDSTSRLPDGNLHATAIGLGQFAAPGATVELHPSSLAPAGGSLPHNNMQPYLVMNFCIALQGVFPPRS